MLESLMAMQCFGNESIASVLTQRHLGTAACPVQSKRHVVRSPHGAQDQSGLTLTSG